MENFSLFMYIHYGIIVLSKPTKIEKIKILKYNKVIKLYMKKQLKTIFYLILAENLCFRHMDGTTKGMQEMTS